MNILLYIRTDWHLRLVPCMKAYKWREVMSPRMLDFTMNKLEVCYPRCVCVCENWKGYVVKHNYVN